MKMEDMLIEGQIVRSCLFCSASWNRQTVAEGGPFALRARFRVRLPGLRETPAVRDPDLQSPGLLMGRSGLLISESPVC